MKKIIFLFVCFVCILAKSNAQDGNSSGIYASYYMSTLNNQDDAKADSRLDFATTFRYAGGYDKVWWLNKNFGTGMQLGYATTGQEYSGLTDTVTKYNFKSSTTLNYGKIAFFVYHRSFNRYKPEARFRFVSYFGPYFGIMPFFKDKTTLYDAAGNELGSSYFDQTGVKDSKTNISIFKLKGTIYNNYDFGFAVAPGIQFMITSKLAVGLNVRADFGLKSLENTSDLKKILTNPNPPYEEAYYYGWDKLYAKYVPLPTGVTKDPYDVRGITRNFAVGATLSIRYYAYPQFSK
jgi:hypothetical protein